MIKSFRFGLIVGLVLALTFPAASPFPAIAQIGINVQGGGGSSASSSGSGSGVTVPSTSDASAYGKQVFAGTGVRGQYGYVETASAVAIENGGAIFALDAQNMVALTADSSTNVINVTRSTDGGRTWGPFTAVTPSGAGQIGTCGVGVKGSSAYYLPCTTSGTRHVVRTTNFTAFTNLDFTGVLPAGGANAMEKSTNYLHLISNNTTGGASHYCRSSDLNPLTATGWACSAPFTGGTGGVAGQTFRGHSIVAVGGGTTLLVVDTTSSGAVTNVYRSTNEGSTWTMVATLSGSSADLIGTPQNAGGNTVNCHSSGNPCWIAAGQWVYKSTDSGATWTEKLNDTTANKYGIVTFAEDTNIMLALYNDCTGSNQSMGMRTADGGTTWTPAVMGLCSSTQGRYWTNITSTSGRFVGGVVSSSPKNGFLAAYYGTAQSQSGNVYGDTPVQIESNGVNLGQKPTYSAGLATPTATAAGTAVFFSICGSTTKTVRVKLFELNGTVATAPTLSTVNLVRTSTVTSGGAASALTKAPHDASSAAATATLVNYYTTLATAGASVGIVGTKTRLFPITGTITNTDYIPQLVWDFRGIDVEPVTLRGTAQCMEASFPVTTTNAPTLTVRVTWTEE